MSLRINLSWILKITKHIIWLVVTQPADYGRVLCKTVVLGINILFIPSNTRKRIEFKILLLAYKCLHGTAPSYLRELLKEYVPPRTLRSTSKNLLCEPRNNMKTYGDRSFSACAPKLWNQLPDNIRAAGSVAIIKRRLKTHLFKDVYNN